jgi:hypothetical protein
LINDSELLRVFFILIILAVPEGESDGLFIFDPVDIWVLNSPTLALDLFRLLK